MHILNHLNPAQKEAVTHEGDKLLVLAGAGSGKTRVLTSRTAWFIQQNINPNSIVLLTFTNKAAGEMRERISTLTNNTPSFAGTFHSFCVRLLRQHAHSIGIDQNFVIYDDKDSIDLVKQILENLNLPEDSYNPNSIANQISFAKNQMLAPHQYAEIAQTDFQEKIFKIYLQYEKMLVDANALDFDNLLLKTVDLLRNDGITQKLQTTLTHILVDEWQDTNKIQYTLTKLLIGESGNLTVVGDAAQSIYSWRGADYRNINNLTKDYKNLKIINLEQNYRSTQVILEAANAVISRNTSHPVLKLWTQNGEGKKIKAHRAASELDEAAFIVSEIQKLTTDHQTPNTNYSDIAVLYRTNAQSRVIEEALLHNAIPYTLVGGVRFYDRKEIKDILALLRLLVNPKDTVSQRRAQKLGVKRYQKFQDFQDSFTPDVDSTTLQILDSLLQKTNYLDKFKKETQDNLSRLENIKELRSVAAQFPDIHQFLENVTLVEANSALPTSGYNSSAITLMTMHSAKGLEFPIVFIIGMEEGLFPHSRSLFDHSELEEERRLAYVGITRAKEALYLTYAAKRLYFGQKTSNPPSRFIIDIPEHLLDQQKPTIGLDIDKLLGL